MASVLTDLFVVLLAAKIGDEIFKRLGQPGLIGEILGGVLVGPSVFGLVGHTEVLEVFAELGVVFLLFWVGLETRLSDIRAVGPSAAKVGMLGVVLPLVAGTGLGFLLDYDTPTSLFLGVALVATSVGITSAVLIDLGILKSSAGRTILGAAVIDDILAMVLLAVAVGMSDAAGVNAVDLVVTLVVAVAFVAFFAIGGTRALHRWPDVLDAPRFSESPLLPAVLLCLGLAALSAHIGLAAIIGAFLAGMVVAETKDQSSIEQEVAPLYAFFPPFFFVFIGLQLPLGELAHGDTLLLVAGVVALAVVTKYVGAWLGARSLGAREARIVGVGMIPRGEVGIVVAGIGSTMGVIDDQLFAVVVSMSVITTLIVPPMLRRVVGEKQLLGEPG